MKTSLLLARQEDVVFPVEEWAINCREGPTGGQDVNSTPSENKSTSRTSEDVCFPVEG